MKTKISISIVLTVLATAGLVACGENEAQKAKEAADKAHHLDTGLDKPMTAAQATVLTRLNDGLYRLRDLRLQADFKVPGEEPTTLSMAARQKFVAKRSTGRAFGVDLAPLQKSVLNSNPKRTDLNVSLPVAMKVPLTIRLHQGRVSFEQIRLFLVCMKNAGTCDRERYLSPGASDNNSVVHPAKYLVTKGLSFHGEDFPTQIRSLLTGGGQDRLWLDFETALDDDNSMRFRLVFERDSQEYEQDLRGNVDEESLRTAEPTP